MLRRIALAFALACALSATAMAEDGTGLGSILRSSIGNGLQTPLGSDVVKVFRGPNGDPVFGLVSTLLGGSAGTLGTVTTQAGTTYTFTPTDCNTEVSFTNAGAVTATIPATLPVGCNIAILQSGVGKVSVTGSAVTAATLHSAHSYTSTSAQWAVIGVNIPSAAVAILTGDGS